MIRAMQPTTPILDLPGKRPVLVFASYRTGSTALCDVIARRNGLLNFDEGLHPGAHPALVARKQRFLAFLKTGDPRFVLKLMPDHITAEYRPLVEQLAKVAFLVRITRRSVVEQVASYYLASTSGIWHETARSPQRDYDIPLDAARLLAARDHILRTNRDLAALDHAYGLDLVHEDLMLDSQFTVYRKPRNHQALLDALAGLMAP